MRSLLTNKKGSADIQEIKGLVVSLVVIGIILGLGLMILGEFFEREVTREPVDGNITEQTEAAGGIGASIDAIRGIAGWLGLIVLVVIAAIILGIVLKRIGGRTGPSPMMSDY